MTVAYAASKTQEVREGGRERRAAGGRDGGGRGTKTSLNSRSATQMTESQFSAEARLPMPMRIPIIATNYWGCCANLNTSIQTASIRSLFTCGHLGVLLKCHLGLCY